MQVELNRATHSSMLRHEEGNSIVQVKRVESILLYKKKKVMQHLLRLNKGLYANRYVNMEEQINISWEVADEKSRRDSSRGQT